MSDDFRGAGFAIKLKVVRNRRGVARISVREGHRSSAEGVPLPTGGGVWSRTVSRNLKARLIQALVWPIVTYGSEAWTLNKELCENIEAFEMQCYRRSMRISYTEHVTNDRTTFL